MSFLLILEKQTSSRIVLSFKFVYLHCYCKYEFLSQISIFLLKIS